MPISFRIDAPRRVVRTIYSGTPSAVDMRHYFASVEADPEYDPSFVRLVDWRDLSGAPVTSDVESLAGLITASARGECPGRQALVVRPGVQYGVGRMLQSMLRFRKCRLEVELFGERSTAEAWLAGPSQSTVAA